MWEVPGPPSNHVPIAGDQYGDNGDFPPGLASGQADEEAEDCARHGVTDEVLEVRVQERGGKDAPDAVEVEGANAVVRQRPAEDEEVGYLDEPFHHEEAHGEADASADAATARVVLRVAAVCAHGRRSAVGLVCPEG